MKRIRDHQVVHRDASRYSTFPWVARLESGDLVAVFRQADRFSRDAAKAGKVTHHDAESWVASMISTDHGRTWDEDTYRVAYKSDMGVNDPAITRLSDGTLLLRVTEIDVRSSAERGVLGTSIISHRVEHGRVAAPRGNVLAVLDVRGNGPAVGRLIEAGAHTATFSREPVTELPDGSWLLPVYSGAPFQTDTAYLLRSYDRGESWGDASVIFRDENAGPSDMQGVNFNETSVMAFPDGEMLAMGRADESFHTEGSYMPVGGVGELRAARSHNWGLSWSRPERTGIFGQPAHLLHLGGDRVLCTYGYRRKPYGVRVVESHDRGKTWMADETLVLREDAPTWDVGYPMTVQLEEDLFLTAYYFVDSEDVRFVAATTWSMR